MSERRERKSASHGEAGYARRPHDAYFTPGWVTRCLLDQIELGAAGVARGETLVWEPACGDGRMAEVIKAAGYRVIASDLADWGYGWIKVDFLKRETWFEMLHGAGRPTLYRVGEDSWLPAKNGVLPTAIVTNPPFDLAVRFIERALRLTEPTHGKVAMLQRHEFDAPSSHHALVRAHPFRCKIVLPRRPRWSDDDRASPRFPYAWYVWDWACPAPQATRYAQDPDRSEPEAML